MTVATGVMVLYVFILIAFAIGHSIFVKAKEDKGTDELETYQEVKERGVKFASQILRNYPETGLITLQEAYERHSQVSQEFDQAFADGIQEVLEQLAGMGKK